MSMLGPWQYAQHCLWLIRRGCKVVWVIWLVVIEVILGQGVLVKAMALICGNPG